MIGRVALFLMLAVAVLAVAGRLHSLRGPQTRTRPIEAARKCPACGAYVIEGQDCRCGLPLPPA